MARLPIVDPTPLPTDRKQGRYTLGEKKQYKRVIGELVNRLHHPDRIIEFMRNKYGLKSKATRKLIEEELERIDSEATELNSARKRVQAERRFARYLEEASSRYFDNKGKMTDVIKIEEVLAKIQGTFAPVKIDINVSITANLAAVIARMTPEEIQMSIDRQKALKIIASNAVKSGLVETNEMKLIEGIIESK